MLQQTQVTTVIDYYKAFLAKFPTIWDLARAGEDEVFQIWQGLGYYSRARNLHKTARILTEEYGGRFPESINGLRSLPGIGEYTAGAIASIAFHQPYPAVDGNVMRVFARLFLLKEDIVLPAVKKAFYLLGQELIAPRDPSSFNQGLMELGALICTPLAPDCSHCPFQGICLAEMAQVQRELPVKKKKARPKTAYMEAAAVFQGEKILVVRRPEHGLLANFRTLPIVEQQEGSAPGGMIRSYLETSYGIHLSEPILLTEKEHLFTHLRWKTSLYRMECLSHSQAEDSEMGWVTLDELKDLAQPVAVKKLLGALPAYPPTGDPMLPGLQKFNC